jgi:hypothetical protein
VRDSSAREPSAGAHNRQRNLLRYRLVNKVAQFGDRSRRKRLLSFSTIAGGVFKKAFCSNRGVAHGLSYTTVSMTAVTAAGLVRVAGAQLPLRNDGQFRPLGPGSKAALQIGRRKWR